MQKQFIVNTPVSQESSDSIKTSGFFAFAKTQNQSTDDPAALTPVERFNEISSIIATGLLRLSLRKLLPLF